MRILIEKKKIKRKERIRKRNKKRALKETLSSAIVSLRDKQKAF